MVFELRVYRIKPGCREEFLEKVGVAVSHMKTHGMRFLAGWRNIEDEDEFVWMRCFSSEDEREEVMDRFYGSEEWLAIGEDIVPYVESREVRFLQSWNDDAWSFMLEASTGR